MLSKKIVIDNLIKNIDKFNNNKILVLGDFMVDQYFFGKAERISSEAPVPIVDIERVENRFGGALNTINNIISLGGKVIPVGVVGNDNMGKWILDECNNKNIDISGIFIDDKRQTTTKTRIIVGINQVIRYDNESKEKIDKIINNKIINFCKKEIFNVDYILISDYDKGVLNAYLIKKLIKMAKSYEKNLIVDPKIDNQLYYKNINIIKTNERNLRITMKLNDNEKYELNTLGLKLFKLLNNNILIITQGKEGMTIFRKNDSYYDLIKISAFPRDVYDVTGAGDTVMAVLALALSSGLNIEEAAFLSNAAAAVKVSKIGTQTISISELKRILTLVDPNILWGKINAK